jgi:hypothetical protein
MGDCGALVFATNQSPPNGARVVYGRSSRARPFPPTPEVASARLLRSRTQDFAARWATHFWCDSIDASKGGDQDQGFHCGLPFRRPVLGLGELREPNLPVNVFAM